MTTLGIDIGNYNLKTSAGIILPAKYSTKENLLQSNEAITFNGSTYYIGTGTLETKLNKAEKQNILPLLYAGILKSTNHPVVNIVVGLPVNQFKTNKDRLKSIITENKVVKLRYKNDFRTLIIENVEVFPEAAGAYYSLEEKPKKCIILDIGGRTTNIAVFENGKFVRADSKAVGMINLYDHMKQYLNSKYTLDLSIEDMEEVIKEGLEVDGGLVDMSFIKPTLKDMLDSIMNELELSYPIRTHKVMLVGGGAFLLYSALKNKINNLERVETYLFSNAIGFKRVGESLWKDVE